jgi:hypothetical protein
VEQDRPDAAGARQRQAAVVEELRKAELVRDRLEDLQRLVGTYPEGHAPERVYDGTIHSSSTFGGMQLMIEFFSTLVRLFKAIVGAWRRDPQFRTLVGLVFFTLLRASADRERWRP